MKPNTVVGRHRRLPPLLTLAIPEAWRQTENYCRNLRADPPHGGEEQVFID